MAVEFKLDPRDQEKYKGPEWVSLEADELNDLPWTVSGPWDRELVKATGLGITKLISYGLIEETADGVTALVWLARKLADVDTPPFAQFNIMWRRVERRAAKVADGDPPASGSSEPSSETDPSQTD